MTSIKKAVEQINPEENPGYWDDPKDLEQEALKEQIISDYENCRETG